MTEMMDMISPEMAQNSTPLDRGFIEEYVRQMGPNGADVLASLIEIYEDTSPDLLGLLESSLDEMNLRDLQRAAHTLKSTSASLGAARLANLCRAVEAQARSLLQSGADADAGFVGEIQTEIGHIKGEFERVCSALDLVRRGF